MYLVDEKHAWNDLGPAFLTPFGYFLINLFADFWFNLTDIASEESHKSLAA